MYKNKYLKYKFKYLNLIGGKFTDNDINKLIVNNNDIGILTKFNEYFMIIFFNNEREDVILFHEIDTEEFIIIDEYDKLNILQIDSFLSFCDKPYTDLPSKITSIITEDELNSIITQIKTTRDIQIKEHDVEFRKDKVLKYPISIEIFAALDSEYFKIFFKTFMRRYYMLSYYIDYNIKHVPEKNWIIVKNILDIEMPLFEEQIRLLEEIRDNVYIFVQLTETTYFKRNTGNIVPEFKELMLFYKDDAKIELWRKLNAKQIELASYLDIIYTNIPSLLDSSIKIMELYEEQIDRDADASYEEFIICNPKLVTDILAKYNFDEKFRISAKNRLAELTRSGKSRKQLSRVTSSSKPLLIYEEHKEILEQLIADDDLLIARKKLADREREAKWIKDRAKRQKDRQRKKDKQKAESVTLVETETIEKIKPVKSKTVDAELDDFKGFIVINKMKLSDMMSIYLSNENIRDSINKSITEVMSYHNIIVLCEGFFSRYITFYDPRISRITEIGHLSIHDDDTNTSLETRYHYKFKEVSPKDGLTYLISYKLVYYNNSFHFIRIYYFNQPLYSDDISRIHTLIMDMILHTLNKSLLNPNNLLQEIFILQKSDLEEEQRILKLYKSYMKL